MARSPPPTPSRPAPGPSPAAARTASARPAITPTATCADAKYGPHPWLQKLFQHKQACSNCANDPGHGLPGLGGFRLFGEKGPQYTLPTAAGGTLAYPHHPFVRSPRDFFMTGD